MPQLLDFVRTRLRRSTKKLDEAELVPLIEAAKLSLHQAGVVVISETDTLTMTAIALYCQWIIERDEVIYGFYKDVRDGMALDARYNGGEMDVESLGC